MKTEDAREKVQSALSRLQAIHPNDRGFAQENILEAVEILEELDWMLSGNRIQTILKTSESRKTP